MKKLLCFLTAVLMLTLSFAGCNGKDNNGTSSDNNQGKSSKPSIVCTNFSEYDFARQIAGDKADITMLLKPGGEVHTFEPSPKDIITIQNSQMFIYVGGDSDDWVDNVMESMDKSKMTIVKMMDCVNLVEEETVEGMQPEEEEESEDDEDEPEMDEHVWTSPANVIKIVNKISEELCKIDPANQNDYKANADNYVSKLETLDNNFKDVIDNAKRKEIIVGDRFPFRYFCEEFGLKYYAAFPGCSSDTEANPSTVAFLIDKVKEDNIPVVFHIELSNEQMCKSICDATGAKSELLNAVHNVSDADFKAGITYIDLMQHNVEVLKEALN